jgi:hypothetical protein
MVLVSVLVIEPEIATAHVVVLKLTMMTTSNVNVLNTCNKVMLTNLVLNNVHVLKESKMVIRPMVSTIMVDSITMLKLIVV